MTTEPPAPTLPAYLTRAELSRRLAVGETTIAKAIRAGMPVVRIFGAVRFDLEAVTAWIAERREGRPRRKPAA